MQSAVIIPARGGSQRIPRKNLHPLMGVPLLERTIQAVRASLAVDAIVVSTDDTEIADIARDAGARVLMRTADLADHNVPVLPVVQDAISRLHEFDISVSDDTPIALVYATAVTLLPEHLDAALNLIADDLFVVSVCSYSHPPQRGFTVGSSHDLVPVDRGALTQRTQDLPEWFHDAGQFVWGRAGTWRNATSILDRARGYVIPRWRTVDLDTPEDLTRAELLIRALGSLGETQIDGSPN